MDIEPGILETHIKDITASMDCVNEKLLQNETIQQDMLTVEENPILQGDHTYKGNLYETQTEEASDMRDSEDTDVQNTGQNSKSGSAKDEDGTDILLCRLCAIPCQGSASVSLFRHPPHHPEVIIKHSSSDHDDETVGDVLSMIKATLPIKVSCCDSLPKQVCKMCIERLRLSHAFIATVLKAESQLNSLRTQHKTFDNDDARNISNSMLTYDCPVCKEVPALLNIQHETQTYTGGSYAWGNVVIKDEPKDTVELSHEELEKCYNDLFGGHKDYDPGRTEERITLKPLKPACVVGRRPRGRPRTRPLKVTPRGKRGRRSTQTTVEKILALGGALPADEDYGFRIRSKENNPASEALTQCLLCERWLPGAASCLQHSLVEHMDCGSFLCPRCPRDDFPGDFELIQHYQESHCPDLELYEVFQAEKSHLNMEKDSQPCAPLEKEPKVVEEQSKPSPVKQKCVNSEQDSSWQEESMDYETLHNTPPNEHYESQDELSSNLSEVAPRSLTSHSALYEEESNSISTHGSDSNMATEEILPRCVPNTNELHDELTVQEQSTGLEDGVAFRNSSTHSAPEFSNNVRPAVEENLNESTLMEQQEFCHSQDPNTDNGKEESQNGDFMTVQVEGQESQDSLRTDDLCGFQEAMSEKSQEVNLNGNDINYDT